MPASLITPVQFESVRKYFLDRAYDLLSVDPDYRLYCHVPGKLVSLSYLKIHYSGEYNIPQNSDEREVVYFDEQGVVIPEPSPKPPVVAEIPLNSGRNKVPDNDLVMRMLVPDFMKGI